MKLFTFPQAPNPRRVALFCQYKGIELNIVPINMAKGEHLSEDFKSKNPLAKLPVLELDDGTCITESLAICFFLESQFSDKPLFGNDPQSQAQIWMWSMRLSAMLETPAEQAFQHLHPARAASVNQISEWGEENIQRLLDGLTFLNSHLDGRAFVCGEAFSMADIVALCAIDFARVSKVKVPDELNAVHQWYERCNEVLSN